MTMKPYALLLYTLIILSVNAKAQNGWILDKDQDGILVYTKEEAESFMKKHDFVVPKKQN